MPGFDDLFQAMQRSVDEGEIPGAAIRISHRGETFGWQGGCRDRQAGASITDDTIYRLASLTKTVTSVIAVQLVAEGRLDLATPLSRYFDGFDRLKVWTPSGPDAGQGTYEPMTREVCVHDLMRHTSGFTYGQFRDGPVEAAYRDACMSDHDQTREDILEKARHLPLASQPGSTFEYGMSTDLLGWLLERVADRDLEELVRERIARPLGLSSMTFSPDAAGIANIAQPQPDPVTGQVPIIGSRNFYEARWTSGGHGLFSIVDDFFRFARMLLAGGTLEGVRILSPAMVRWMTSDHLPPGIGFGPSREGLGGAAPTPELGQGFGLGFCVRLQPGKSYWPGSAGDFYWCGLSGTYFWADPVQELTAVLAMQAPNEREHFRSLMRRMVYGAV